MDLGIAEESLSMNESQVSNLSAKYNEAVADRKKMSDDFKDLEKECEKLRKQVKELSFKEQVYNQGLTETRTRCQVEISEIDGRLTEQYEAKLQQSLQKLSNQYEAQMRMNREEIELLYENKVRKFLVLYIFGFLLDMKLAKIFMHKY
jgi:lamin B